MMIKKIILVAFGGALGSVFRFLISTAIKNNRLPIATFAVNMFGSFLIGCIMAIYYTKNNFEDWRLFLVTGICGGFTTFSAFSWECLQLLQQQRYVVAILYISLSFMVGIIATYIGFSCIKS